MAQVSYARRLTDLAERDPDRPAISCAGETITRAGMESAANRLARDLAAGGVRAGDMVTIGLANSIDWFVAGRVGMSV